MNRATAILGAARFSLLAGGLDNQVAGHFAADASSHQTHSCGEKAPPGPDLPGAPAMRSRLCENAVTLTPGVPSDRVLHYETVAGFSVSGS